MTITEIEMRSDSDPNLLLQANSSFVWYRNVKVLWALLGVMTLAIVGLCVGLALPTTEAAQPISAGASPASPDLLFSRPTITNLDQTISSFTAGEGVTAGVKYTEASMATPVAALSTPHMQRYSLEVDGPLAGHLWTGMTKIKAVGSDEVTHCMYTEVTTNATLGEFASVHGQVGNRTLRVAIRDMATNDTAYLVPFSASMVWLNDTGYNDTMVPNFFYFSYYRNGSVPSDTHYVDGSVVTFVSRAHTANPVFFLGNGAAEWDRIVTPFLRSYWAALAADEAPNSPARRRLLNWSKFGATEGGKLGGWAGAKYGGELGGDLGGDAGGAAGGALGGSIAGPVGAAIGEEAGHWVGAKVGSWAGSKIGGDVGRDVGSAIGGKVGSWF